MLKSSRVKHRKVATRPAFAVLLLALLLLLLTGCGAAGPAASNGSGGTGSREESPVSGPESSAMEESKAESEESKAEESKTESEDSKAEISSSPAVGTDGLKEALEKDVDDMLSGLTGEYDALIAEVDTYEKYLANTDRIEAFYKKTVETVRQFCIKLREYSVSYASVIVSSDGSHYDRYDELEAIYDDIYDDAGEEIYDGIYDDLLGDIYDAFYDGILEDAYDDASYKEWSNARSDEYDWWSDARSDVYDEWSSFRSDVYDFCSDVRSAVYKDDDKRALSKIDDFIEDIGKMK